MIILEWLSLGAVVVVLGYALLMALAEASDE